MLPEMVVFLQNAWSPVYRGCRWPRPSWLLALQRSRSGQRLRVLLDDFGVCENTTPAVGATPDSILPPDVEHIQTILVQRQPHVVVTCGKQAEAVLLKLWSGPLLAVPHPAHRLLTDALYREARLLLECGFSERLALRQERGHIRQEMLTAEVVRPQV